METMHLIGSEDVARAGRNIEGAAEQMSRAASAIEIALDFHARRIEDVEQRMAGHDIRLNSEAETLRDKFAGLALQGQLSRLAIHDGFVKFQSMPIINHICKTSYEIADAMLRARSVS